MENINYVNYATIALIFLLIGFISGYFVFNNDEEIDYTGYHKVENDCLYLKVRGPSSSLGEIITIDLDIDLDKYVLDGEKNGD